jgi:polyisoprenyl-phosphate glycosyltransferase
MKNKASVKLSVVIPCFNEEGNLEELYQRLTMSCTKVVENNYECIFVNDGSNDNTWELLKDMAKNDNRVIAVSLSRNHGHQLALSAGLSLCRGQRILIIDADLQDPPELLNKMMNMMDQGIDIVYGQRSIRKGETWFKKASASAFYRILNRLVDIEIPLDTGDFRLINRRVLRILNNMPEQHRFMRGMISWIGFKKEPLFYERDERFAGETKYPMTKMVKFALDAVTGFSIKPLRIASLIGFVFGLLGLIGILYALASWLMEKTITGWTSVVIIILVLGSVQLLTIGIIGEYLGRLYLESKKRPLYLIDEVINMDMDELKEITL